MTRPLPISSSTASTIAPQRKYSFSGFALYSSSLFFNGFRGLEIVDIPITPSGRWSTSAVTARAKCPRKPTDWLLTQPISPRSSPPNVKVDVSCSTSAMPATVIRSHVARRCGARIRSGVTASLLRKR